MAREEIYKAVDALYEVLLEEAMCLDGLEEVDVHGEKLVDQLFGLVSVMFTLINGEEK